MFISIPVIIVIVVVLAWSNSQTEADKLIEEMRDPGGLKRQALIDSARADSLARKAERKANRPALLKNAALVALGLFIAAGVLLLRTAGAVVGVLLILGVPALIIQIALIFIK